MNIRIITGRFFRLLSFSLLICNNTNAGDLNTFNYQGKLMDSSGSSPISGNVGFKIGIYNPDENCLLYEETQTINLTTADGYFSLKIGSDIGSGKRTQSDPNLSFSSVFNNAGQKSGNDCTYSPQAQDNRKIRVTISLPGSNPYPLPFQEINQSPFATVADTLDGKSPSDFVLQSEIGTLTGPTGPQGPTGENGTNGVTWLSGSSAPLAASGAAGDFYLNTANGDYYKKTLVGWSIQGSLIGPKGDIGDAGLLSASSPLVYDSVNKTLSLDVVPISNGGTGASTAAQALANLLPSQTGNSGKFLSTDGSTIFWNSPTVSSSSATSTTSAITDFSSYPLTISATTSNPVLPTNSGGVLINKAVARFVGDSLEVLYKLELGTSVSGGSNGTGTYLFSLPGNLEIDFSKLGTGGTQNRVVGTAYVSSGGQARDAVVAIKSDYVNKFIIMYETGGGTTPGDLRSDQTPGTGAGLFQTAGTIISFEARVPIRGKSSGLNPDFNITLPTGTLPVLSGLYAHYTAESLSSLSNASPVSSWPDSSGATGAVPLTQSTASAQPLYIASAINGLPAVRGDGVNDIISTSRAFPETTTVFLVASSREASNVNNTVFYTSAVDGTPRTQMGKRSTNQLYHYGITTTGTGVFNNITTATSSPTSISANVAFVSTLVLNKGVTPTKFVGYLNGNQSFSLDNYGNGTNSVVALFAAQAATSYQSGDIAELIIYSRALSVSEISTVNLYLKNKYGITN